MILNSSNQKQSHSRLSERAQRFSLAICLIVCAVGCQSQNHPWVGLPYQAPSEIQQDSSSTYAPVPSILPSVEASEYAPGLQVQALRNNEVDEQFLESLDLDDLDSLDLDDLGLDEEDE